MAVQQEAEPIVFAGSAASKKLAEQILGLMRIHGRFMSADAPIRVDFASIHGYLSRDGKGPTENAVRIALSDNSTVFSLDEVNDRLIVSTTLEGRAPIERDAGPTHTFQQRFMTPLPKAEKPALPVRERPRVDERWATLPAVLEGLDLDEGDDVLAEDVADVLETATPAAAEVVEAPAVDEILSEDVAVAEAAVESESPVDREPAARVITLPVAPATDVTGVDDVELAAAIGARLRSDPRVASFGDQWMMEDRVPRFSRGDLRRMREYIQEQEQPLTDDLLVQDVLSVRPGTAEFDLMRFAVNFRLSREHREFDFVGTSNQRFWSTSNLPQIGTTRRKPNEIGTDYRFLLEETPNGIEPRSIESVDHTLTFYEYYHGLLPYNADLQALLPGPLVPNQRSTVLTFESPQSYTTYLVELRYPTPNRGGFILGLDDLFSENLVPGAIISISRTENDGHYLVEYIQEANQQARLLEIDDRRAQRYVFRPTTYACGVDDSALITEERFAGLGSERPLDEKARRRPESVIAATFERIGEQREGGYWASFDKLFAAVNVERPFSTLLLRSILDNDDTGAFSRDPDGADAYTYVPGSTP